MEIFAFLSNLHKHDGIINRYTFFCIRNELEQIKFIARDANQFTFIYYVFDVDCLNWIFLTLEREKKFSEKKENSKLQSEYGIVYTYICTKQIFPSKKSP